MSERPCVPLPTFINGGYNRLVRARYGYHVINANDIGVGAQIATYGEYAEAEIEIFRRFANPGWSVADIGANIGTHTLALASLVGESGWVYAFEPQRLVFQALCANIALNSIPNVDAVNAALGAEPCMAPIEEPDPRAANNFGGLALGTTHCGRYALVLSLDAYLDGRKVDFLKIDVEGMELDVLLGARAAIERWHPVIYVENFWREKSPALIRHLMDAGYICHWHIPSEYNPANFRGAPNAFQDAHGNPTHAFAINMLCVPPGREIDTTGLMEVESIDEHPRWPHCTRFYAAINGR